MFDNCNIFFGDIFIYRSTSIVFSNCLFSANEIFEQGSINTIFDGNKIFGAITRNRNYNGETSTSYWTDTKYLVAGDLDKEGARVTDDLRWTLIELTDNSTFFARADGANSSMGMRSNHPLSIVTNNIDRIVINDDGEVTQPTQSCFAAYNGVTDVNQTGGGTLVTVDFNIEDYDKNNDFSGNVFTAPVTGIYQFSSNVHMQNVTSSMTDIQIQITGTSDTILRESANAANYLNLSLYVAGYLEMVAGDTARIQVRFSGATDTADIFGAGPWALKYTYFSGSLIN